MKHIKDFEGFLNEARITPETLDDFWQDVIGSAFGLSRLKLNPVKWKERVTNAVQVAQEFKKKHNIKTIDQLLKMFKDTFGEVDDEDDKITGNEMMTDDYEHIKSVIKSIEKEAGVKLF